MSWADIKIKTEPYHAAVDEKRIHKCMGPLASGLKELRDTLDLHHAEIHFQQESVKNLIAVQDRLNSENLYTHNHMQRELADLKSLKTGMIDDIADLMHRVSKLPQVDTNLALIGRRVTENENRYQKQLADDRKEVVKFVNEAVEKIVGELNRRTSKHAQETSELVQKVYSKTKWALYIACGSVILNKILFILLLSK